MKVTNEKLLKYLIIAILAIPIFVILYIFAPLQLIKEFSVWAIFILFILTMAIISIYLINRYRKEDKGRLERMLENITAGIVGAVLVTFLDKSQVYQFGIQTLSPESLLQLIIGIAYIAALFIFILAVTLLPIWILLSYIEKD